MELVMTGLSIDDDNDDDDDDSIAGQVSLLLMHNR